MSDKQVSSFSSSLRQHKAAIGVALCSAVLSAYLYIARKRRIQQYVEIEGDGETSRSDLDEIRERAEAIGSVRAVLKLNFTPNRYLGSLRYTFQLKSPHPNLKLDFAGFKITEFRINHKSKQPVWRQGQVELGALCMGIHEVEIRFEGKYSGNGLISLGNVVLYPGSPGNRQLHRILPCFDQPDIKTSWEVLIAVPSAWQMLSLDYCKRVRAFEGCCPNSDMVFDMENEGKGALHEFYTSAKVSPEHFSICAGLLSLVTLPTKPTISVYSRPEITWKIDVKGLLETLKRAIRHFKAASGVPYPFAKLDIVFLPTASSYAASIIYLSEDLLSDIWAPFASVAALEEVLLKELAGQWVGVVLTYKTLQEYPEWVEVARKMMRDVRGDSLMSPTQANVLKRAFSLYKWGNCSQSALKE